MPKRVGQAALHLDFVKFHRPERLLPQDIGMSCLKYVTPDLQLWYSRLNVPVHRGYGGSASML